MMRAVDFRNVSNLLSGGNTTATSNTPQQVIKKKGILNVVKYPVRIPPISGKRSFKATGIFTGEMKKNYPPGISNFQKCIPKRSSELDIINP